MISASRIGSRRTANGPFLLPFTLMFDLLVLGLAAVRHPPEASAVPALPAPAGAGVRFVHFSCFSMGWSGCRLRAGAAARFSFLRKMVGGTCHRGGYHPRPQVGATCASAAQ